MSLWCALRRAPALAFRLLPRSLSAPAAEAAPTVAAPSPPPSPPPPPPPAPLPPPSGWTPSSRRTGVIAMKVGMLPCWDKWGTRIPCTVLQIDGCQVVQVKDSATHGFTALQLGCGPVKLKNVKSTQLHHFEKYGVEPKRKLWEFPVTPDAVLPSGTSLSCLHFVPGQKLDVCGITKGKGFQGVMKLHGFTGQPASHGCTKAHRKGGSYGQRQDPSKVFKGKKMPGRMGGDRRTIQGLTLFKIEPARNLLYVKGAVPGVPGGYLRVTDSIVGKFLSPPPFPTFVPKEGEELPEEIVAPPPAEDPNKWFYDK